MKQNLEENIMKKYIASVRDKETKKLMLIEREYDRKADFESDLRCNGYAIRFITTPDKFDEACEKWHEYNERCKYVSRRMTELGMQKWQRK
jgi:hypothetical protein